MQAEHNFRTWAASRDVANVLAGALLHSRGTTMPRSLKPARVHRAMQGGWGPKHLGDSGRHQRAKQIAADIEECPKITRAYKWFETASKLTQATPPRDLPLARLVRDGNDHIRTVEAMVTSENACVFEKRIWKWKALVAAWEAARGAEVLPAAFTAAAAWFGAAKQHRFTTVVETLERLASEGSRHLIAVNNSCSSCPRGSHATITRRFVKWKELVNSWNLVLINARSQLIGGRRRRHWQTLRDISDVKSRLARANKERNEIAMQLEAQNLKWPVHRAKQRKKRTCSMCGKTAPNSSRAFDYCGGCRHVPRVDRPRYCSEECQRAHWLAGHMDECPSCNG